LYQLQFHTLARPVRKDRAETDWHEAAMIRTALIPAAGRGSRLDRPGTPKPLVDAGGVPLIVRVLKQLEAAGVERAVVVAGYRRREVVRALTYHPELKLALEFVEHPNWRDGLASSLLAARERVLAPRPGSGQAVGGDGPFLLAMADHVFDDALVARMAAAEPEPGGLVALSEPRLERVFDPAAAVKLQVTDGRVRAAGRGLQGADAVDAGLFLATPALFDSLADVVMPGVEVDLSEAVNRLARQGRVRALPTDGLAWDDVDTPAALVHTEMRLRSRKRALQVSQRPSGTPLASPDYRFATGRPATTEIVVQRGLVAHPERVELIPPESASSPVFVFTDETVNRLYGDAFVGGLQAQGYDVHRLVMADGEESKTLANYVHLVERVLARGIDERSVLVSLGGGAVCNVCGLIASTLYRGIGLVHVPTTLMAQCDAAISHKQGVNGSRGKNLVGSYYAPRRIVVDVEVLASLEDWLIEDGLAEVLKHALGQDPAYLDLLLSYQGQARDPAFLEQVVRRNIELKCALMAEDPHEHAQGMVLQYGHTVGHPVEYLSGYSLSHGQSVAIGMMTAARVARLLGACDDSLVAVHERLLKKFRLPTCIPSGIQVPDILEAMRYNKRFLKEGTRMALLDGPGRLWSVDGDFAIPVSDAVLERALLATLEAA
jgi:3-dehydroquinate synthase